MTTTPKPAPLFVAVKKTVTVMRGGVHIANACSATMARRIANALNWYRPNDKGY